jgi:hypothetical protein
MFALLRISYWSTRDIVKRETVLFDFLLVYAVSRLIFGCTLPERRGCESRSSFGDMRVAATLCHEVVS